MIELNEPQVWTLIGVFAAALFGVITLVTTMFVRVIRSEIGGLRGEILAEIGVVSRRIDALDRDVQALVKHTFGIDRG
ncbi:hypothetical protein [Agromyces italicus]|uniref:hypothetical protein n=1 Tax=Agromyces italicus TaxID=279572 RepID=UPI0003B455D1|nr:hypothetical protein [Agromyces italicus]